MVWSWDDTEFLILNPDDAQSRRNDASCVLQVRSRHGTILLPADIEKKTEARLAERLGGALHADILVAPHHGSKTSSSADFLNTVQPRYVLLPVGYRNRYRHPHPAVIERYRALGSRLYDSPSAGAIELRLRASGVEISAYREERRRYWFVDAAAP
jgi:competence protein ComEC